MKEWAAEQGVAYVTARRWLTLARTGRRVLLHLAARAPWADLVHRAVLRLRALAVPG